MKGVGVDDRTIRSSKINGDLKSQLTTSEDIVQEGLLFLHFEVFESKLVRVNVYFHNSSLCGIFELPKINIPSLQLFVLSRFAILESLDHQVKSFVVVS